MPARDDVISPSCAQCYVGGVRVRESEDCLSAVYVARIPSRAWHGVTEGVEAAEVKSCRLCGGLQGVVGKESQGGSAVALAVVA